MRIGTRRSALALAQAKLIAEMLGGAEIVPMLTAGDRESSRSLSQSAHAGDAGRPPAASDAGEPLPAGDKSRWVAELEDALSGGEIDLAVHSAKDVPGELADGLALLGTPARAASEDVLCGASALDELPAGARVGTSSIRRLAQLRAVREDLDVVAVRGNVDTRLRKLGDPQERLDAIVLARAGLQRLGREAEAGGTLDPERFVPAPGQGTLALEGRANDERARAAVRTLTDRDTFACLLAERALAHALDANCHTPLGAYAVPTGDGGLYLRAWVGLPDGSAWVSDELVETGTGLDPETLGREVAQRLSAAGGAELLRRSQKMAGQVA
jgi:hydroxymethylbilane synthase